jgi:hypothetical protein
MRQRLGAQLIDQLRRAEDHFLQGRVLAVEDAQRVAVQTPPAVVVEQFAVLLEIADQLGTMARTLARLAQRVELQGYAVEPEVIPQAGTHQDLFGIDVRAGKAE